ncbi:MAG TPA: SPOR domain-containing protein [Blastocatellia bacterium]|nr:SPOR domain-containing protein [Blastocatellia bacterium]
MQSRISPLALLAILVLCPSSQAGPARFEYTLQVAAFPDQHSTEIFAAQLTRAGKSPVWGSVNIAGRGIWYRVYIGEFETYARAQAEGVNLLSQGIIKEFLVKRVSEIGLLGRSRRTKIKERYSTGYESHSTAAPVSTNGGPSRHMEKYSTTPALRALSKPVKLPVSARVIASLVPSADSSHIPRPDPARLAFNIIAGGGGLDVSRKSGGIWLSGDIEDAMARLQWIVGVKNAKLLGVESDGRLRVDAAMLREFISTYSVDPSDETLLMADYISSNEGLLLIVQMSKGSNRYLLHIGSRAPTRGPEVAINGSINLDNNFDSRINPYRRNRMKLSQELPPEGFDAMVAINPAARWFNLRAHRIVPVGHITFHELAEAHAKVALRLDYLGQGIRPGAHSVALDREKILNSQRPGSDIVLTSGSNRVLRSNQELRQLFAETAASGDQR